MAKLKVVHKLVGLGRVQNFMLIVGRVGLNHITCGSDQENWTHIQLRAIGLANLALSRIARCCHLAKLMASLEP